MTQTKTPEEIISHLEQLQTGTKWGCKTNRYFVHIRPLAGETRKYEIECGWVVPEAHDDDYDSMGPWPFADGRPKPWVGRRLHIASAADVLTKYREWQDAMLDHKAVREGEAIGSVYRQGN